MAAGPAHPPVPVTAVLEHAVDSLLGGSGGWLRVPAGGYLNGTWLSRRKCYRITIDVTPGHPFDPQAETFLAELRERIKRTPS